MSDDTQRLVDALDSAIPPHSDTFHDPADDPLVELAQDLARLEVTALPTDALDRIEARIKDGINAAGSGRSSLFGRSWWLMLIPIIVLIAVVGGVIYIASGDDASSISPTESAAPTQTLAAPLPNPTIPTADPVSLTLEGEIEAIRPDGIVIYGIEISVSEEMLVDFQVGDVVRVQATAIENDVFVAISIEILTPPTSIPVNPPQPGGQSAPSSDGDDNDDDD